MLDNFTEPKDKMKEVGNNGYFAIFAILPGLAIAVWAGVRHANRKININRSRTITN